MKQIGDSRTGYSLVLLRYLPTVLHVMEEGRRKKKRVLLLLLLFPSARGAGGGGMCQGAGKRKGIFPLLRRAGGLSVYLNNPCLLYALLYIL